MFTVRKAFGQIGLSVLGLAVVHCMIWKDFGIETIISVMDKKLSSPI